MSLYLVRDPDTRVAVWLAWVDTTNVRVFTWFTELAVYTPSDLLAAATQLNSRPRKTLNWDTPARRLDMLLTADH